MNASGHGTTRGPFPDAPSMIATAAFALLALWAAEVLVFLYGYRSHEQA